MHTPSHPRMHWNVREWRKDPDPDPDTGKRRRVMWPLRSFPKLIRDDPLRSSVISQHEPATGDQGGRCAVPCLAFDRADRTVADARRG